MFNEIERFVKWIRRRNPNAHTWRDYRCDLQQFADAVGDRPPTDISFKDIDNFITSQTGRGLNPATVNRRLAAITSFYAFLSDEFPNIVCPVLPHRHILRERRRLPRPVPEGDLKQFLAVIDNTRDWAMFLLMLRCGLRISEVAKLRLRDIYLDESPQRLLVHGKNSKERTVYLSAQAAYALRQYLAERPSAASNFVFLSYQNDGMSTTAIHKRLMHYRKKAGVHLTAHQLRHSFANDLVCAEVPVTSIQKLLGHFWLTTTQTYVAANDPQVQADFFAAAQRLEGWQNE
ncbi:MAG: tyrosine-type recombinase/integrase [Candidatus Promineifilaceae bacterium]|nr:tyrosine-type recombinase/integrase [Candidatus Promineifilaceae bacterium]